jgi:hypothetical protein
MTTSKIDHNIDNTNKLFNVGDIVKHTIEEYYLLITKGNYKMGSAGCWNTVVDGVVIVSSNSFNNLASPIGNPVLGELVEKFQKVSKGTSVTLTQD